MTQQEQPVSTTNEVENQDFFQEYLPSTIYDKFEHLPICIGRAIIIGIPGYFLGARVIGLIMTQLEIKQVMASIGTTTATCFLYEGGGLCKRKRYSGL